MSEITNINARGREWSIGRKYNLSRAILGKVSTFLTKNRKICQRQNAEPLYDIKT